MGTSTGSSVGAHHDQFTVDGQSSDSCTHGLSTRDGCEDNFRSAETRKRFRHILGTAVNIVPRPQFLRQCLFIFSSGNGYRLESHLARKLYAQMSKTADTQNSDHVTGARAAIAKGIEGRNAGTKQRGPLQGLRDPLVCEPRLRRERSCIRHSLHHS